MDSSAMPTLEPETTPVRWAVVQSPESSPRRRGRLVSSSRHARRVVDGVHPAWCDVAPVAGAPIVCVEVVVSSGRLGGSKVHPNIVSTGAFHNMSSANFANLPASVSRCNNKARSRRRQPGKRRRRQRRLGGQLATSLAQATRARTGQGDTGLFLFIVSSLSSSS